jgi:hypothetical protein
MFEGLAFALVKTLATYLFNGYLKNHYGSIDIEGGPFWYGREPSNEICVSTYRNGGLEELELTKNNAKIKLTKKINNIIGIVIYQNPHFKHLKADEEKFLDRIKSDKKLPLFVDANLEYKNIKVDKDKRMVFVRSCVKKDSFIKYEKERIEEIRKKLTYYKADKAFDELKGKKKRNIDEFDEEDKAFHELDSF